jgi:hypothetical protein
MSNTEKPDEAGDLTPEERRRLETWKAPDPPPGFSAQVVTRARAHQAPAPSRTTAPLSRAERERRRRRRSAAAAVLGGVAVSGGGGFVAWQAAVAQAAGTSHAMTIYLAALAFGGVLLIASLVGGHGHADHDAGHADGHDGDHDHGADADSAAHAALVLPFLSLRFWIFGLTFFGLTGAILHGFGLAGPLATAIIASVMGLGMGLWRRPGLPDPGPPDGGPDRRRRRPRGPRGQAVVAHRARPARQDARGGERGGHRPPDRDRRGEAAAGGHRGADRGDARDRGGHRAQPHLEPPNRTRRRAVNLDLPSLATPIGIAAGGARRPGLPDPLHEPLPLHLPAQRDPDLLGRKHRNPDGSEAGYRVIFGGRAWRVPLIEQVGRMDMRTIPIDVQVHGAYTRVGIALKVKAIAVVKISSHRRW